MARFAARTGLDPEGPQKRYLWTDAFAVCNYLALARVTGEERHRELALRLIDRVHHTLGRHRPDDPRQGWLSGLGESEGEAHPTRGGLRIGKELPERRPDEPVDEQLEWDRDGQYFHYLTRWMHALDQTARAAGQPRFNLWARELLQAAWKGFLRRGRLVWKMSIDLSYPLVASSGQHDPLDGFVTCAQLRDTASKLPGAPEEPRLDEAQSGLAALIRSDLLASDDPLGIGGLLMDGCRLAQLPHDARLLQDVLAAAEEGLEHFARRSHLRQPAWQRLAFRELGLAIGLHAVEHIETFETLRGYFPLAAKIESFWLQHRDWSEHRDINEVMLASSLLPFFDAAR